MTKEEIENLILENEKLAYYIAHKFKFKCNFMDFEDLKSVCILGLVKSANTFDENKNFKFTTYAVKCITNEVLMILRNHSKVTNEVSLESLVYKDLSISDRISDDNINIENDYINLSEINNLLEIIETLPEMQKSIIKLSLKYKTQQQIAKQLNISQPQVSRLYKQALYNLRLEYERRNLDEGKRLY